MDFMLLYSKMRSITQLSTYMRGIPESGKSSKILNLKTDYYAMMPNKSKVRTSEQKSNKMLKEEKTIVDLELAVKKEHIKNKTKKMLKEEKTIIDLELAVKKEEFKKLPKRGSKLNF
ncbi:MAG: hypothetical protein ACE5DT_04320 [Nitrosopumilus sp.]